MCGRKYYMAFFGSDFDRKITIVNIKIIPNLIPMTTRFDNRVNMVGQ